MASISVSEWCIQTLQIIILAVELVREALYTIQSEIDRNETAYGYQAPLITDVTTGKQRFNIPCNQLPFLYQKLLRQ